MHTHHYIAGILGLCTVTVNTAGAIYVTDWILELGIIISNRFGMAN